MAARVSRYGTQHACVRCAKLIRWKSDKCWDCVIKARANGKSGGRSTAA